ncbi:competence protein [Pseudoalteromonas carrageenovora]|uniref:Competence protein ComM n=1 Tax=Pseudoalteromonas carrageenovora IAM 12662 TaxID=1314868 RepID=A0A2K4XDF1_PSEVC|nr:YifB family Mg chelatase-like AAA ATPase [Pseudoalteromonas carrageenovora]MBE0381211.1 magnesium chelatase family protein [Pseudoalteromonas carrageenovora IAM 12662]MDO6548260.1 YifB family Mg chelatase-like AAA ATPase [Pseudoalteromonas carrageenovora]MDO6832707.1 YifB family Mg chelatase-like AAA ATPase [Pseudoalteromonas carrageenovora]QBJ73218.1 competence protein [Pseudoalteromonas carrageenovora]SOU42341.1 Competence protein ComM [Pseudoalteromonas carrageenovora IAM 12662]
MSLARIYSRAQVGINAPEVIVEVHLGNGLPAFHIVGLPEASVKESKDRVRSALENSQFGFPDQRITVNLAPADLPKDGGRFDLAIAVGILVASGQIVCPDIHKYEFYGELALNGEVRGVNAILPSVLAAKEQDRCCFLPFANDSLASLVNGVKRKAVSSLQEVWGDLLNQQPLPLNIEYPDCTQAPDFLLDLSDVKGQPGAKRVLEIAAAGGHNLLFLGPPGTGKSMLAQRMATIMPTMSDDEAISTAALYSIIGQSIDLTNWRQRPFRNPHHTCSAVALVGGSSNPKPGEISLAHNGVLFLDELPEFERKVLDSLREPMETGTVTISRAARQMEFPAQFQLITALNPSPTGSHTDKRATPDQVMRYLSRVSGPFIDRIDLQIELPRLTSIELQSTKPEESSAQVRARVEAAYYIQLKRQGKVNARLNNKEMNVHCELASPELQFLARASEKLSLSPRSYHRVIKVARTISDLKGAENISLDELKEALNYRAFERLLAQLAK